jgi:hypothetical protein
MGYSKQQEKHGGGGKGSAYYFKNYSDMRERVEVEKEMREAKKMLHNSLESPQTLGRSCICAKKLSLPVSRTAKKLSMYSAIVS